MTLEVSVVGPDGSHQSGDVVAFCRVVAECMPKIHWPVALLLIVNIDCTGQGGHGLEVSIHGPSVTPEALGQDDVHHVFLVALGGSKAMYEFLVPHYWPPTVLKNGTPSWIYACVLVYGFALARGDFLLCTCTTSVM